MEIELIRHDMRELTLDRAFDGAYCFGNSFGYLDHAGTVEFLCGLGAALRPGARFVLDTGMAAESILPELEQNPWWQVDDILLAVENLYVPAESRLDTRYTFVQDGKTETREAHHWVFTVAEIGRMLTAAGLSVRSLHASTDGEPYQAGAERLLLTAKKPE